ncbi:MAG: class I tRNA ligase family protein [Acidobacteriota bacterium]
MSQRPILRRLDPESFFNAYNVGLQMLYPWEGVVDKPPFGAAWASLAPGEETKPHAHQELESFFIVRGQGRMAVGDQRFEVGPGDVTFHHPFDQHRLRNLSQDEDLLFLTVWWEDRDAWTPQEETESAARVLVTAAPPTPNGDLHLGHLAGPYLAGDFHARYLRLRGSDACFVTGSDDNSIFVEAEGRRIGRQPQETADHYATLIAETLDLAGVELAAFPRPNRAPAHRPLAEELFLRLHQQGHLVEREDPYPFCRRCDRSLYESFLKGLCPHCGSGMVGHTCEDCGRVHDAPDLLEAACTVCDDAPELVPTRRWVFPLEPHREILREHLRQVAMGGRLVALCEDLMAHELPEITVTHRTHWGIEVPMAGYEEQRLYVWLEMAPRYLAYSRQVLAPDGDWPLHWKDPAGQVVQCFGFDNSFYYALLIPALLKAFDPEIRLPTAYLSNEFYHLGGLKFSTSRGHRILGRQLLAEAPRDAVRYYLASTAPEREETRFTLDEFHAALRHDLLGDWQDWLGGVEARCRALGDEIPSTGDWNDEQRRFYQRLEDLLEDAAGAWSAVAFSPQRAVRVLGEIVREARRFGAAQQDWSRVESRHEEWRTAIALELLAVKGLCLAAAPLMPETADRLWHALGFSGEIAAGAWTEALDWLPAGQRRGDLSQPLIPGLETYLATHGAVIERSERPPAPSANQPALSPR